MRRIDRYTILLNRIERHELDIVAVGLGVGRADAIRLLLHQEALRLARSQSDDGRESGRAVVVDHVPA